MQTVLRLDPLSGHLFLFLSRRKDQGSLLYWDSSGYALWRKRLERGRFRLPVPASGSAASAQIEAADLSLILEGIDLRALKRLRDGTLAIDNNHTERTQRPVAVGRKNWLFAGSDEEAERLAVLYTVVASCDLAGLLDPWAYLRDVLYMLSRGFPRSRLDELLPLAWKATATAL